MSRDEYKKKLSPEAFEVCFNAATEAPFTGKWLSNKEAGAYVCAACGAELFKSQTKFDSGTGWPSFWDPSHGAAVDSKEDLSHGRKRTEVLCRQCGAHLGHVFDDGPQPTGKRYCINSLSLDFKKA